MRTFISYARADGKVAEEIASSLRQAGLKVFIDVDGIAKGDDYHRVIWEEVQASDLYVYLMSERSVAQGSFCLTELGFAEKKWPDPSHRVLPVAIDGTPMSHFPTYAKISDILKPSGNLVSEVRSEVTRMAGRLRRGSRLRWAVVVAVLALVALLATPASIQAYKLHRFNTVIGARKTLAELGEPFEYKHMRRAVMDGDTDLVDLYLRAGMSAEGEPGFYSNLYLAIRHSRGNDNYVRIVKLLLKADVKIGPREVAVAFVVSKGKQQTILQLITSRLTSKPNRVEILEEALLHAGSGLAVEALLAQPGCCNEAARSAAFAHRAGVEIFNARDMSAFQALMAAGVANEAKQQAVRSTLRQAGMSGTRFHLDGFRMLLADDPSLSQVVKDELEKKTIDLTGKFGPRLLEILIELNVDLDSVDSKGRTLLISNVESVSVKIEIVRRLLESGADPNLAGPDGQVPLCFAHKAMVYGILKRFGAEVSDAQCLNYNHPMAWAASSGDVAYYHLVRAAGDELSAPEQRNVLLVRAIEFNQEPMFRALLEGSDPNRVNDRGQLPLVYAVEEARAWAVRLLIRAGADPDQPDARGVSARDIANGEMLQILAGESRAASAGARGDRNTQKTKPGWSIEILPCTGSHGFPANQIRTQLLREKRRQRQLKSGFSLPIQKVELRRLSDYRLGSSEAKRNQIIGRERPQMLELQRMIRLAVGREFELHRPTGLHGSRLLRVIVCGSKRTSH